MNLDLKEIKFNILEATMITIIISLLLTNNLFYFFFDHNAAFTLFTILSILSTVLSGILIYSSNKIYTLGFFSVLFLYFTMTHFGASTIFLIYPQAIYDNFEAHQYEWLYNENIITALYLCINAQLIYVIVGYLFSFKNEQTIKDESVKSRWLPKIGILLVLYIFIYFMINIITGGISLTGSYSDFNNWKADSGFISWALFFLATGFILAIATGTKNQIYKVIFLYTLVGLILFLTGNKGEVLYAALVGMAIYYSRFGIVSKKVIFLFIFLFFIVVPFISSTRGDSVLGSLNEMGISLIEPFLETGWQLRTVVEMVNWHESGESLGWGISYLAPIQRILSTMTLGIIPAIPLQGVPWSFGERLPGWGFSQVAESYYNFNILGPILFHGFLGWFATMVDSTKNNQYKKGFYASIAVILMILTRNRFSFVPGQILLAFMIIIFALLIDKYQKKNK